MNVYKGGIKRRVNRIIWSLLVEAKIKTLRNGRWIPEEVTELVITEVRELSKVEYRRKYEGKIIEKLGTV